MQLISKLDIYPDKAQYRPGDSGCIVLELETQCDLTIDVVADFMLLTKPALREKATLHARKGESLTAHIPFRASNDDWACFGVDVSLYAHGKYVGGASTAFDVADHWRRAPRYGFLSDFGKDEAGRLEDVKSLNRFHLNVIQFYDWMYRHDQLIPPEDEFTDPMGRLLSFRVVKEKIRALHERGMAAIAYGAVYASLPDFYEQNRSWALYKRNGEPFHLIGIFHIMDISPGSAWNERIVSEFNRVIEVGFDGIHMDQYGFPKKALRYVEGKEELVDLAQCYPQLINTVKKRLLATNPDVGLIFNNVSNYPVHTTAKADQDAVYIEVWPPYIHLRELKALIDRGRDLGKNKQVILACYLPAFKPDSGCAVDSAEYGAFLTMATIFASGGYHLLIGEDNKVLTEAYYPSYSSMRPEFASKVRQYYDFIVRYGRLLYDPNLVDVSMAYTGGINSEVRFQGSAPFAPNGDVHTVWTIVKQLENYQVIHLINLTGLEDDHWERPKATPPMVQENILCTVLAEQKVRGVYLVTPDSTSIRPQPLDFRVTNHEQGEAIEFRIPRLDIWDMVFIEYGEEESGP